MTIAQQRIIAKPQSQFVHVVENLMDEYLECGRQQSGARKNPKKALAREASDPDDCGRPDKRKRPGSLRAFITTNSLPVHRMWRSPLRHNLPGVIRQRFRLRQQIERLGHLGIGLGSHLKTSLLPKSIDED